MRLPFLALLMAIPLTAVSQTTSGTYRDVAWSVNEHHTLVWGGQPYLPIGLVTDGNPGAIEAARATGVGDVVVDMPTSRSGWSEALDALNKGGLRYMVRFGSMAKLAPGIAVEPQSYRISSIDTKRTITVRLPGVQSVLAVFTSVRDAYVKSAVRVPVVNGVLTYEVNPTAGLEHVLLLYPQSTGLELPDFWEGLDQSRDEILNTVKHANLGPGLRGFVNPLGRTLSLPGKELHFVPTSPMFRMEFAALLEQRYRTVETVQRMWSMNGSSFSTSTDLKQPLTTFSDLSSLVPLWSGTRGVALLWDPTTDRTYACDNKKSTIWKDIIDAVCQAGVRRFDRLVNAIRKVADVPVIQEWNGWSAPYEGNASTLTGVGMHVAGLNLSQVTDQAACPASSLLRWTRPGWLVATDVTPMPDAASLPGLLDNLASLGAKGTFLSVRSPDLMKAVVAENTKRSTDAALVDYTPSTVFYPENASNPASTQRLPGGRWWLPTPAPGDRIDLGPSFFAYRMQIAGSMTTVMWAAQAGRVRLRFANPKAAVFEAIDGTAPAPILAKNGVDVNITQSPLLVSGTTEIPVPEPALSDVLTRFAALMKRADAAKRDATEARMTFQQALQSLERSPDTAFGLLLGAYYDASQALGAFTWIQAESPVKTNFSEAIDDPACSNGRALSLRTVLAPDSLFFAEYPVPVRSTEEQQVFLAARIPVEQRKFVQVLLGGQTLLIQGDPIGAYGDGFAWYRLGTTRLAGSESLLRLSVTSPDTTDLAIDAIVLTPVPFVPDGVRPPDPVTVRH